MSTEGLHEAAPIQPPATAPLSAGAPTDGNTIQLLSDVESDDWPSPVAYVPLIDNNGALILPPISEPDPFLIFPPCPDCNIELTTQYFLEEGHCRPTEIPPSDYTELPQDWKCCNPHCEVFVFVVV